MKHRVIKPFNPNFVCLALIIFSLNARADRCERLWSSYGGFLNYHQSKVRKLDEDSIYDFYKGFDQTFSQTIHLCNDDPFLRSFLFESLKTYSSSAGMWFKKNERFSFKKKLKNKKLTDSEIEQIVSQSTLKFAHRVSRLLQEKLKEVDTSSQNYEVVLKSIQQLISDREDLLNRGIGVLSKFQKKVYQFSNRIEDSSSWIGAVSEGYIEGVDRFDLSRERGFVNYVSFWMRDSIWSKLIEDLYLVRIPQGIFKVNISIKKDFQNALLELDKTEADLTPEERKKILSRIGEYYKFTIYEVERALMVQGKQVDSLSHPPENKKNEEGTYSPLVDQLPSTVDETDVHIYKEQKEQVVQWIDETDFLSPLDRHIFKMRIFSEKTYREIAESLPEYFPGHKKVTYQAIEFRFKISLETLKKEFKKRGEK
ncbi:MAG: hypothetical protein CL678_10055 [Bdellovibrionaceae bacterium]|nr:hypothetical protein [Pseudobdellovibrionaceae bacterium]|tara:strand:- start:976 stop:2250 length:1275 start_codon:yes stop_codon:yes gene_type:complete